MKAHLVDCTYCEDRLVTFGEKRPRVPEMERCRLTMLPVPQPGYPGRFCEHFHQEGHDCVNCFGDSNLHMENMIDK
jgi:hypothetical protein